MGNSFYTVDTDVAPGTVTQQYPGLGFVYPANIPTDNTQPLHAWYYPGGNGQHILTASTDGEGGAIQANGYQYQKIECLAPVAGTPEAIPVYRFWHQNVGDHCFSRNGDDAAILGDDYVREGVAFYVFKEQKPGTLLLRYYNIGDAPRYSKGGRQNTGDGCPPGYHSVAGHGCVPDDAMHYDPGKLPH